MKGATGFWVAIAIALLVSFGVDLANTIQGGAIDFRNRITGVRLLEHGIDAYTFKWHHGDPDLYCDVFNNPQLPVSKTTATPTLLVLHAPLALLPYRAAEFAWLFAQWLMLLGIGWLWHRACETERQRELLAVFLAGFTYTAAWRLHAERGQAYVLLALVFAGWLAVTLDKTWSRQWAAGCLAGLLIALRPPFLLLVPFLALHRRAQLPGLAVGLLAGIGLPLLIHPASWQDYYAAMQMNSELYRNNVDPAPGPQTLPAQIEGTSTDLVGKFAVIPYADFSAFALLRWLGVEHNWLGNEAVPAWPLLLVAVAGFALWLVWTQRRALEALLAGLAAWMFLADLFLPAFRNTYNDVLILDVLAAGLVAARLGPSSKIPWAIWICMAALPVGWLVYGFVPEQFSVSFLSDPAAMQLATAVINLPTALFTIAAVMCLFRSRARQRVEG
jgi:hypothetical protein